MKVKKRDETEIMLIHVNFRLNHPQKSDRKAMTQPRNFGFTTKSLKNREFPILSVLRLKCVF